MDSLIQVDELDRMSDCAQKPVIIGILPRWQFLQSHIPGSSQVWRAEISSSLSSRLVEADGFEHWARGIGVRADSRIVIWDRRYDATRLWWAFQCYGKSEVQVLDGGLRSWKQARRNIRRFVPTRNSTPMPGNFIACQSARFLNAEIEDVLHSEMNSDVQLWDCRSYAEWTGQRRLTDASKAGRIPWAKHLPWQLFRHDQRLNHSFRSLDAVQEVVDAYGLDRSKKQIFYCQSGVRSTVPIFSLYRLGWDPTGILNYDGSWKEWSQSELLPSYREV
jgi:thiosulfate/3-mercaptopyruvate sulfurtransferase